MPVNNKCVYNIKRASIHIKTAKHRLTSKSKFFERELLIKKGLFICIDE